MCEAKEVAKVFRIDRVSVIIDVLVHTGRECRRAENLLYEKSSSGLNSGGKITSAIVKLPGCAAFYRRSRSVAQFTVKYGLENKVAAFKKRTSELN